MLPGRVPMECGQFAIGNAKLPSLIDGRSVKPANNDETDSSTGLGVSKPYNASDMVRTISRSTHGSRIPSSDVYKTYVVRVIRLEWRFT